MKILLLGSTGQVGWELQRSLAPLGELVALGRDAQRNPQGLCGDLSDLSGLSKTVRSLQPQVIVNAAAYTAVDRAETDMEQAALINAGAPALLAEEAAKLNAWLVHYSTDYVFDGSGGEPWKEMDATGPLNAYGHTKLAGEQAVMRCARHLIFRTSWVYAARGGNFAKTMLRLAQERETLQVIDDQMGAPTGADLIADVTAHAIRRVLPGNAGGNAVDNEALAGIYHLVAAGCTSWYEYAKYVVALAERAQPAIKIVAKDIKAVPSSAFPTPAKRPHNSRLDTTKLQTTFGLQLPSWQAGVNRMLNEIDYGRTH
jgi:dTDP-4-dehydrorhamnose reductase